jgi:acetylornithine deacetylase/succinyl-diaminopimelate desuccinylase-like protein
LKSDAHSAAAAVVQSAPWRLVEGLASLRDRDGTVCIDGFSDSVRGTTEAERQAVVEASDSMEVGFRETLGIDSFIDDLTGSDLREQISFRPTCNIAGIKSGYSGPGLKTVLPAEASAWLDFRLVPDQRPDEVLALLRSHLQRHGFEDLEVTVVGAAEAAGTPIDHPLVRRVARIAAEVTGQTASITPRIGGTSRSSPRSSATSTSLAWPLPTIPSRRPRPRHPLHTRSLPGPRDRRLTNCGGRRR